MRVLLVGPPGAGKGTQAVRLAEELDVPHLASGNLLREAIAQGTTLGHKAKGYMDKGDLVPDDLVIQLMEARMSLPDCEGFVLDGFPRTGVQAKALDDALERAELPLQVVLLMQVDRDELIRRITGRRTCPQCQRPYHMIYNQPKDNETCDEDGYKLTTRPDDTLEAFAHRLDVYQAEADELVGHYAQGGLVKRVHGIGTVDEVHDRIAEAI